MGHEIRRLLTKFHRSEDRRASAIDVTGIPFADLTRIVRPGPDDPLLYHCYRLDKEQLAALQPYVNETIDATRFEYDLEVEAEPQ